MTSDKNKDIEGLIKRSGNSFHCEVVKSLREKGWDILVSPYYTDNVTGKSREIDIIADKKYEVNVFGAFLNVRFFIECKSVKKETIFWFDKKDMVKATERARKEMGFKFPDNAYLEECHYLKDEKVAKLFSSSSEKNLDNEPIYKALNQILTAFLYYRNRYSAVTKNLTTEHKILKIIKYPIILLDSFAKLFKVEIENSKSYSKIDDNFLLEVNYAYLDENKNAKDDYFLIDVVDFNKFDNFLEEMGNNDIKAVRERFG